MGDPHAEAPVVRNERANVLRAEHRLTKSEKLSRVPR
jgi:hypothetical protein